MKETCIQGLDDTLLRVALCNHHMHCYIVRMPQHCKCSLTHDMHKVQPSSRQTVTDLRTLQFYVKYGMQA